MTIRVNVRFLGGGKGHDKDVKMDGVHESEGELAA